MADSGQQLELSGMPAGWDVLERVQVAKRAGSYSLVRVRDREQYEEAVRLLGQMSVDQVARLTGWSWRTVAAIRDAEAGRIAEQKESLGRKAMSLALRTMESFEEDLHSGRVDAKTKAIAAGILTEKGLLLMGEATVISAQKGDGPRMDRGAFLDVLARAVPAVEVGRLDEASSEARPVCRGLPAVAAVGVGGGAGGDGAEPAGGDGGSGSDGGQDEGTEGGGGGSDFPRAVGGRMGKGGENFLAKWRLHLQRNQGGRCRRCEKSAGFRATWNGSLA